MSAVTAFATSEGFRGIEFVGAAENPLLEPSPGLMVWTLVLFGITLLILKRYVFGPVGAALEKRRTQIQQSIEDAESSRDEAVRLLEEYRTQLAEARKEADVLRERGRREGDAQRAEIVGAAEAQRDRVLRDTEEQVQAQTRDAMSGIRDDIVGLALGAAERVTGRTLSDEDHRRLIQEAVQQADLSGFRDGSS